ncbi:MAG: Hsp20/alpha crystallin family protein [Spirochaetaceae bacterium]|jgi:HSP20 family protein|nr:Hsp20/alpha crystallin family protein [Spirochaetaceae bacterium]
MKTVTLYRPLSIEKALHDFDHYMESFFGDSSMIPAGKVPPVDIREYEDHYTMEMELPGFDEKDIEVQVNGGSLSIASRKETEHKEEPEKPEVKKDGRFLIRERKVTSFSRSFTLPESADPDQIAACFKNGILALELKKRPEVKKRLISIESR